jgi:hypothetical protein
MGAEAAENLLDDGSGLPTAPPTPFLYPRQSALDSIAATQAAHAEALRRWGMPSALSQLPGIISFAPKAAFDTAMIGPRLFGDVAEGRIDPTSPEGVRRTVDAALTTLGFGALGAERGAIGMAGGAATAPSIKDALQAQHEALVAKIAAGKPKVTLPTGPGEFSKLAPIAQTAEEGAKQFLKDHLGFIPAGEPLAWAKNYGLTSPETYKAGTALKHPTLYDASAVAKQTGGTSIDTALKTMPTPAWKKAPSLEDLDEYGARDLRRDSTYFASAKRIGEPDEVGAKGSNTGAFYNLPDDSRWYIKDAPSTEHAANEKLGNELYRVAGAFTPIVHAIEFQGKPAIASKVLPNMRIVGAPEATPPAFGERLASDVWLKNYDAIGTTGNNVMTDPWGNVARIDQGATMAYRANGAKKTGTQFDANSVAEDWALMTGAVPSEEKWATSKYAAAARQIPREAVQRSVWRLSGVADEDIAKTVQRHGYGTDEERAATTSTLIARRDAVLRMAEADGYSPRPQTRGEVMDTFFPQDVVRGSQGRTLKPGAEVRAEPTSPFYGSTSPELANLYAGQIEYTAGPRATGEPEFPDFGEFTADRTGANLWPMRWRTENFLHVDAGGAKYSGTPSGAAIRNEALRQARLEGRDGVVVHNIYDEPSGGTRILGEPKDVYIALRGANVRSKTAAKFNPAHWNLNDFTAAVGGIIVPAGAATQLYRGTDGEAHAVHPMPDGFNPFGDVRQ